MNDSQIVIIGANGQLGLALQKRYPNARAVDSDQLDITNDSSIDSFDWSNTTHIINAAAYTNVDGAETPDGRRLSWAVNAVGPSNLSRLSSKRDITLVHISSDYVFDGSASPHVENEPFSPLGVYGQSKAAGDIAVGLAPKHFIVRTSWVIGDGKNFIRTMIGVAEKNISPDVVGDQIGRLTFTSTLVDAINHLLTHGAPYGTYNVSNDGNASSWADITRTLFSKINRGDLTVTDITTEQYFASKPESAPRPLQSTLDLNKIQSIGFHPQSWESALDTYLASIT